MKTTLLMLALALSSFTALAQGRIAIANDTGRLFVVAGYGPIPNGPLPSGHVIVLALYAGTNSGSMTLQTSYAVTGGNWLTYGRTATKPMSLIGVPQTIYSGIVPFFNIILTDNGATLPNTIDGTLAGGTQIPGNGGLGSLLFPAATYYGASGLFQQYASSDFPTLLNGTGTTWPTGNIYIGVPEPSSIAVSSLGTISLLLFRWRK